MKVVDPYAKELPAVVKAAIRCGPPFHYRDWRRVPREELTMAERCMMFVEKFLHVPDGPLVGQKMLLHPFQEALFYQIFDTDCWQVVYSAGRKNAKTATCAAIAACYILGPAAETNASLVSAANSRDQAAHLYNYMTKMFAFNPQLAVKYRSSPSGKRILGLSRNVEFKAISADAKNNYGGNHRVVFVDELGQTIGPVNPMFDALATGQGGQEKPKLIILSTQAPNDSDLLSTIIDTAIRDNDQTVAVHLYSAPRECELDDRGGWAAANPAPFRSVPDIERQANGAKVLPSSEGRFRNLILNQRITQHNLLIGPQSWKQLGGAPATAEELCYYPLHLGLDLSLRKDLTACVASFERDNGEIVLHPLVFIPEQGLVEKSLHDRAPYDVWVKQGYLIAVPGPMITYDWVAEYIMRHFARSTLASIQFDLWNINHFKEAAARAGLFANHWQPVGQGYRDFAPRVNAFEEAVLSGRLVHGNHPLLNMAAANAVVVSDPAGNRKIDKSKTSAKIDPLVAAIMACFPLLDGRKEGISIESYIA